MKFQICHMQIFFMEIVCEHCLWWIQSSNMDYENILLKIIVEINKFWLYIKLEQILLQKLLQFGILCTITSAKATFSYRSD